MKLAIGMMVVLASLLGPILGPSSTESQPATPRSSEGRYFQANPPYFADLQRAGRGRSAGVQLSRPGELLSPAPLAGHNVTLVDIWEAAPCRAIDVQGNTIYAGFSALIAILDISDPTQPVKLSNFQTTKTIDDIEVHGDFAYLMDDDGGIWVVDVSDPSNPSLSTKLPSIGSQTGARVTWYDSCLYACTWYDGMFIFDVSIPSSPVQLGHFPAASSAHDVAVQGNTAYMANFSDGLAVIDVTDKSNPTELGRWGQDDWIIVGVDVAGDYAYATSIFGNEGLWVVDVSDRTNPVDVGYKYLRFIASDVVVGNGYAYVTWLEDSNHEELAVIDVGDPTTPTWVAGVSGIYGSRVALREDIVCVAAENDGATLVDVSMPTAPFVIGDYPTLGHYTNLVGYSEFLALARDYSLTMVRIDDPRNQYDLGLTFGQDRLSDIEIQGTYAFVSSCDEWDGPWQGLFVVDIQDPTQPVEISNLSPFCIGSIAVEGDYLYFTSGGLFYVVDISDPEFPVPVGTASCNWVSGIDVQNGLAFLAARGDGLRIWDVSTPTAPVEVGYYDDGWFVWDVAVSGDYAYLAGCEFCSVGLRVLDITDPTAPSPTASFDTGGPLTQVVVTGHHLYACGSWLNDRLWIYDISNPAIPQEAGYFDSGGIDRVAVLPPYVYARSSLHGGLFILLTDLASGADNNDAGSRLSLAQNHPNPFNPSTAISFTLPRATRARLEIYDVKGRVVRKLLDQVTAAGLSKVVWDGTDDGGRPVASGVYFYQLTTDGRSQAKKMILLK